MGVQPATVAMLLEARRLGVNFNETLTLGRQNLICSPPYLAQVFKKFNLWPPGMSEEEFESLIRRNPYLADPVFSLLGAKQVSAMDISDFEGANIIHDLNLPLPAELRGKFDVVFDGGLLEHVFNFPTAMKSVMELVRVGGHLLIVTTANNYCGHGFYQFSPELFYRVLSEENGYHIKHLSLVEEETIQGSLWGRSYSDTLDGRRFEVPDPQEVGARVNLVNNRPILINIIAQRAHDAPIFQNTPQQSDYAKQWSVSENSSGEMNDSSLSSEADGGGQRKKSLSEGSILHLRMHLISRILRAINPLHHRNLYKDYTFANKKHFREVNLKEPRRK